MDLLKALSETPAASGREELLRAFIQEKVSPHVDEMDTDALGNLICIRRANKDVSSPKRVMLACHMDEIAFYVRSIDENGFLRLKEVGGFDTRNLFARQVLIQGRKDLFGVMNPSGPPVHIAKEEDKKQIPRIIDLFVDTGLPPEEVLALVRPGDPVTLVQTFRQLGHCVTGTCMDNRAACWTGIRLLEEIKDPQHDLYVVFTVQEEVGIRGARTAAFSTKPDIGIAIDVTLAVDTPGMPKEEGITDLGKGVAIKVLDGASISDYQLVNTFEEVAQKKNIPNQREILPRGGTDAAGIQMAREGVRVLTLSIPCRYIHTVTETIDQRDLRACVDLLLAVLQQDLF